MGTRGPIPKPAETRRRRNTPEIPVKKAPRGAPAKAKRAPAPKTTKATKAAAPTSAVKAAKEAHAAEVEEMIPEPNTQWHPIARNWYISLALSGQSDFYEPSDWSTAYLMAESMSRDLMPQFVGFTESGEILMESIPLKGSSLAAYLKGMGNLLVTEGDRRRMSVDLVRGERVDPDAERALALVTQLRPHRSA